MRVTEDHRGNACRMGMQIEVFSPVDEIEEPTCQLDGFC